MNQIIHNLPFAEYLKLPYLSRSRIAPAVMESMAHYKANLPVEETSAMMMGTAAEFYALYPHKFFDQYPKPPVGDGTKNAFSKKNGEPLNNGGCKEALDAHKETLRTRGLPALSFVEWGQAFGMGYALRADPDALATIDGAEHKQATILWERDGMQWKSRPDLLTIEPALIEVPDIKTTSCAETQAWEYSIDDFCYDLQFAMIEDGLRACRYEQEIRFWHVIVESKPPHIVAVRQADESVLESGRWKFREAIRRIKLCEKAGVWPGYDFDLGTMKRENKMSVATARMNARIIF